MLTAITHNKETGVIHFFTEDGPVLRLHEKQASMEKCLEKTSAAGMELFPFSYKNNGQEETLYARPYAVSYISTSVPVEPDSYDNPLETDVTIGVVGKGTVKTKALDMSYFWPFYFRWERALRKNEILKIESSEALTDISQAGHVLLNTAHIGRIFGDLNELHIEFKKAGLLSLHAPQDQNMNQILDNLRERHDGTNEGIAKAFNDARLTKDAVTRKYQHDLAFKIACKMPEVRGLVLNNDIGHPYYTRPSDIAAVQQREDRIILLYKPHYGLLGDIIPVESTIFYVDKKEASRAYERIQDMISENKSDPLSKTSLAKPHKKSGPAPT